MKQSKRPKILRLPAETDDLGPLKFGDWLVRRQLITRGQLFVALKRSYRQRCRVGDAVVRIGWIDRQTVEDEAQRLVSFNAFCGQCSTWTREVTK